MTARRHTIPHGQSTPGGSEVASARENVLLRNAILQSGEVADVLVVGDRITAVGAGARADPQAVEATVHDLSGYLLLPSAAEPHAHLDRAMLGDRFLNASGDLNGAIDAVRRSYESTTEDEIFGRASTALATAVSHGYTAMRTHAACEAGIGTRAVRALCRLRDEWADLVDMQVVALVAPPITGRDGAAHRAVLAEAISAGADLVGGAPWLDPNPEEAVRLLTEAAAAAGLAIDLHLDETTDPEVGTLSTFAAEVTRCGLSGRATASHCVSLGQQPPEDAVKVAGQLREAGVGIVTLPQTNLFLQGRATTTRVPRGLTAVRILRSEGVVLAAGGDNWRDPFNPLGRIDPLETAGLLMCAAHLDAADAYAAVSQAPRQLLGLRPVAVESGSQGDLLAVRAHDLAEAIAAGPADRWVFRRGQLVARTRVLTEVEPSSAGRH